MGAPNHGSTCYIQAILQQIGDVSSILWVVSVSFTINKLTQLTMMPTKTELQSLYLKMNVIIWSITTVLTLLPFTTDSYGVAGGWCWIRGTKPLDIMWRYLCFYIIIWLAIAYMIVVYIKVFKRLTEIDDIDMNEDDDFSDEELDKFNVVETTEFEEEAGGTTGSQSVISINNEHESSEELQRKMERRRNNTLQRMKYYPLILIVCYTFATIRRVIDWATVDQTSFILALLHTFFAEIQGCLNAICYGFTKDVKIKDKEALDKYCCCSSDKNGNRQIVDRDSEDDEL